MDSRYLSKLRAYGAAVLLASALAAGVGCDESLPPVTEPSNVLTTSLSLNLGVNKFVYMSNNMAPSGNDGAVDVKVTNVYKDALSDSEGVDVNVVIYQTSHPERRDTIVCDRQAVVNQSLFYIYLLAIPPGQTLEIMKQWTHSFLDSTGWVPFWKVADLDSTIDVSGRSIGVYKVTFTVSATVRVFKTRPTESVPPQKFTVYYRTDGPS